MSMAKIKLSSMSKFRDIYASILSEYEYKFTKCSETSLDRPVFFQTIVKNKQLLAQIDSLITSMGRIDEQQQISDSHISELSKQFDEIISAAANAAAGELSIVIKERRTSFRPSRNWREISNSRQ